MLISLMATSYSSVPNCRGGVVTDFEIFYHQFHFIKTPHFMKFGIDYFNPTNNLPNSFIFMRFRVYFPHFLPKFSDPPTLYDPPILSF